MNGRVVSQRHLGASRQSLVIAAGIGIIAVLACGTLAAFALPTGHRPRFAAANTAVITYKGGVTHVGQYPNETTLTTSNVTTTDFGRVASYPVDGQVYAQPLYVPNVATPSGTYNLIFVATEHDSIYAFDADHILTTPIWHTTFLVNGATTVPATDVYPGVYVDIQPEVGITGTPVIDLGSNTLYVSVMTKESGIYIHRLHALDITTGADKMAPVTETATVPGTGDGSYHGTLIFDPQTENQRGALILLGGVVYVPFGSFSDNYPYHGWVLGFNTTNLAQATVYNASSNSGGGGIWAAGGALAADPTDNSIYLSTGNGAFTLNTGGIDAGDSVVKLSTTGGLKVADYFAPFNQQCLNTNDKDLGSGGVLILPAQTGAHPSELVAGGKEGRIYVLDRTNLGGYTAVTDPCNNTSSTSYDQIVQELAPGVVGTGGIYSTPAYWNGSVYEGGNGDAMKAFSLTNGLLSTSAVTQTPETFNYPGANPVISSNGTTPGTGIVWIISPPASCPVNDHCNPSGSGALRAYDATNLGVELYSSSQNVARDGLASYVKFSTPIVANGDVYVGTANSLDIFGLNPPPVTQTPTPTIAPTSTPPPALPPYNNVGVSDDSAPTLGHFDGSNSYSAQALAAVGITPGAAIPFNNVQFTWPAAATGAPNNWQAAGQVIPITPVAGATTVGILGAAVVGPASATAIITYTDGTTQPFTLTFSDWTLNGGGNGPSAGNQIAVHTAYRNTPTGPNTVQTNVFYADMRLQSGKVIQSLTLPMLWKLHIFAVGTTASAAIAAPPPYNNVGVTYDAGTLSGHFDGANSYSSQALQAANVTPGAPITINGVNFIWPVPVPGTLDNWQAAGQVIPVTAVSGAHALGILGAAVVGPVSGTATITYTDGTTQSFTLTFSDWTLNGGGGALSAGNQVAVRTTYRNTPLGQDNETTYVFYTDVALQSGKVAQSLTLPNAGGLHVFAVGTTTSGPATSPTSPPPFTNAGVSDDSAPTLGHFDGANSYSAQALAAVGITPGASVTVNGVTFIWPSAGSGTPNNWRAAGQVIPITPVAPNTATTIALLGAAVFGATSGTATITYTDGTTQSFTLTFSDWTLNGGGGALSAGNQIAARMTYRNTPSGAQTVTTYVFYTDVALQSGKVVKSLTLPTAGNIHVFAIGTK